VDPQSALCSSASVTRRYLVTRRHDVPLPSHLARSQRVTTSAQVGLRAVCTLHFMSRGSPSQGDLQHQWIVDSGASRTMCSNCDWFSHFSHLPVPVNIALGDNSSIQGTGVGRIGVSMKAAGTWHHAVLQDILYVPELHRNLLSVSQLAHCSADVRFAKGGCQIYDQCSTLTCEGSLRGNLYIMPIRVVAPEETARVAVVQLDSFPVDGDVATPNAKVALATRNSTSKADVHTWHRRFGHLHINAVLAMVRKGMVKGMDIVGSHSPPDTCEACLKGKQTRAEINKLTESRATDVLGRVFSDICRKLPTCLHQGFEYVTTWIDDASRKVFVTGLREKSEVAEHLKSFVTRVELDMGKSLKVLQTDGGGEYIASAVQGFLKDKGIQHEVTTPDTPQHNGVAECMNCTLLDKVWSMLHDASLPEMYWHDALVYAAHLHNVTPKHALEGITPEEAWSGNKPDVSHLHVFSTQAFVHVPDKQRTKLGAKSLTCTFLSFAQNRRAYRLVHRSSRCFLESRNIVFNEGGTEKCYEHVILEPAAMESGSAAEGDPPATNVAPNSKDSSDSESEQEIEGILSPPPASAPPAGRPKRATRTPVRDDDPRYAISSYSRHKPAEHAKSAHLADVDPCTYKEAMSRPDVVEWEVACQAEMHSFEHMHVYEVAPRPKNKNVVSSKWVFCIKRGPDSAILKYKARVVTQGFTQIEGVDYDETFAPVAKLASLRAILAIAAELDLEVHQMDVKSAYLNGELKEDIYMKPPPGFDVPKGMVLKLVKALYGTKQGRRVWYENIRDTLKSMGYERTKADHAVFTRVRSSALSILALYVDNITMACKSLETINQDKERLKEHYEMTDLGELAWILGVHVTRDRHAGWIALSQEKYALEILECFGKSDVHPISTPTLANEHLIKINSPEVEVQLYQRTVGALMYLMLGTRPDLAYTVAALGQHSACPGIDHQHALDHAFRYLRATSDWKLVFQRGVSNRIVLKGFVDADWASNVNDRKSTSGFVFMLAGGAISWG
jgi:transposase InsO family protein